MAVYLSKHRGLAGSERVTIENYRNVIAKIGISKLPETLLKGHQYYSANIDKYGVNSSITETINDYLADLNAYVDKLPSKKQKEIFEEDKGYSGNKWEGKNYKNTRDLSTAEISKLIKKELEIEFEDMAKFSVVSDVYSGGSSINVTITDLTFIPYTEHFLKHLEAGKSIADYNEENHDQYNRYAKRFNEEFNTLIKKVEHIANQYNFDDSDSQTDYFHVRYYEHVKFDEERYLLKHYPESPEAKRRKQWDDHWTKSKANSKAKADSRKGKFKKGEIVWFKASMHQSWHKFKQSNGMYLAEISKSPNGRALFSSYTIRILEDIKLLNDASQKYHKTYGLEKYYIKNEYGTFYFSSGISASEKDLLAFDDPAAKVQPTQEAQTPQKIKHQLPQSAKIQVPEQERERIITPEVEEEQPNKQNIPRHLKVKAYELVTLENYFNHSFDSSGWPVNLKNGHEFITGETEGFKNIDLAQEDEQIRTAINTYLSDLNEYLQDNPEKAANVEPNAKPVREISPSVKLIKRFANLHGKTLTEKQLGAFIKAMQKEMALQHIRATDPYHATIYHIQDVLVDTFNDADPNDRIQFTIKGGDKYKAIGKSETEMLSVKFVKRYAGLIGKIDTTKQRRLHTDISKAMEAGKIAHNDPLFSYLKNALSSLHDAYTGKGKLLVSDAELFGLQGLGFIPAMIAAAVGKGIEHFAHKALKPGSDVDGIGCACLDHTTNGTEGTQPQPVKDQDEDTVQSIGEVKKMEFDLIGLDDLYLELIGEACRPTSFLIYGPGGSGKSTFTLLFGNYMAQKGNRVLYVAGEQKDTPVFTKMVNRLKIQDNKNLGIVKRVANHDLNNYDILVIDSKDSINYTLEDFIKQREQYPHLSFVILSQATKNGGFTGTEKWRNEVDTLVFCEKMIAYTNRDKNRWGGSSEIKILDLIKQ